MLNPFDIIIEKINAAQEKILIEILKVNSAQPAPESKTVFLTREEVAELLKINISSVFNWTKRGVLTGYQFEGSSRVYYKLHEIEEALIKLKN